MVAVVVAFGRLAAVVAVVVMGAAGHQVAAVVGHLAVVAAVGSGKSFNRAVKINSKRKCCVALKYFPQMCI